MSSWVPEASARCKEGKETLSDLDRTQPASASISQARELMTALEPLIKYPSITVTVTFTVTWVRT